jgi:hypothetical protein
MWKRPAESESPAGRAAIPPIVETIQDRMTASVASGGGNSDLRAARPM